MKRSGETTKRGGVAASLLLGGAVGLLALPSAVLAFSSRFDAMPVSPIARSEIETITPSALDPRLARSIAVRTLSKGQLYRFTPASTATGPGRSVTVAVRVDPASAQAISGRSPLAEADTGVGPMRIAPVAYSLGVSRGYKSFAQGLVLPSDVRKLDMPDLARFGTKPVASEPRFTPRIALDEHAKPGQAPHTIEGAGEQSVDVGGSYRLGRNLNVTAGVRYSQERDRLLSTVDGKQDGQAVYVGTRFRF